MIRTNSFRPRIWTDLPIVPLPAMALGWDGDIGLFLRVAPPRIHGELLKLGILVSERTVSRYLPDRLTRRSQAWRTFLANHIGNLAFASTMTASFVTSDDDVDALVLPCRPVPPSRDGQYAANRWGWFDWPPSLQSTSLGWRVAQHQLRRRTRFSTGKDPPASWAVNLCWRRMGGGSLR